MSYLQEPVIFKKFLEPYISIVFGKYFNTGLLLIFGIIFSLILYFIPKKYKFRAVLAASIVFALISSTIANFALFFLIVIMLFICSNYEFKFKNFIFWLTEAFLLVSNMLFYKIFNFYSAFYSFAAYYTVYRSIHYFVDVRQGSLKKAGFIDYLSYLYYFLSFSHGPVERIENLNPDDVTKDRIKSGFRRILKGLLKYASLLYVISYLEFFLISLFEYTAFDYNFLNWANNIAINGAAAKQIFFSWSHFWEWLVVAAYLGAIKIYMLFSGDIDIVIGVSSLMGFKISENFPKFPYIQTSLTKFWQNWQSTIVNWLTAYVYFPLCRNRRHVYLKTMIIIMIIGWGHLFYNFKDFPSIEIIAYYTLWGVFLGGAFALSKAIERKPFVAKIINSDNLLVKVISAFITFNIIAIGWLSPLYIIISNLR